MHHACVWLLQIPIMQVSPDFILYQISSVFTQDFVFTGALKPPAYAIGIVADASLLFLCLIRINLTFFQTK